MSDGCQKTFLVDHVPQMLFAQNVFFFHHLHVLCANKFPIHVHNLYTRVYMFSTKIPRRTICNNDSLSWLNISYRPICGAPVTHVRTHPYQWSYAKRSLIRGILSRSSDDRSTDFRNASSNIVDTRECWWLFRPRPYIHVQSNLSMMLLSSSRCFCAYTIICFILIYTHILITITDIRNHYFVSK